MAGRYEPVNARDEDDHNTRSSHPTPNSPPPSFHSRQSSRDRANRVDATLADAFDSDGDDSDDEGDDRQRLVRGNSFPVSREQSQPAPTGARTAASNSRSEDASLVGNPLAHARIYGGGQQNEGVFSNLMAKPERGGEEKEEQPPTYEQAAADSAPPYWETTILAPGLGGPDEVYIDGMPVGSFFSFVWNAMVSMSFQLVGFLLTYLLHSSHAAKNGSRAGLGVTLIQYGFMLRAPVGGGGGSDPAPKMDGQDGYADPPNPNSHKFDPEEVTGGGGGFDEITGSEWISYVLMVVGWFLLIKSIAEYLKARRHEQLVLQSPDRGLPVPIVAEGESAERAV